MRKKKEKQNIYWIKSSTRENLVLFYNELNEAIVDAGNKEIDAKRKWTQAKAKKVCKPVLDKWEKTFQGERKVLQLHMEIPTTWIKKEKLKSKK